MTSTAPSNRITTPSPIQDGMVTNCDGFYLVKSGDQCQSIADGNGITLTQFYAFNPAVGTQCESLWGGTYACIHILGTGPNAVTKSPPTTTAAASNRITTPKSIQPGIVGNCNSFYLVQPGEACAAIADKNSITLSQFYAWNTQVGTGCSSLWANAYACVGIIGYVKSTPTTSKGNGITTPTPIQTGMTTRCKKFHLVAGGETCDPIAKAAGISLQQFLNWNPAASSTCSALWANTYCCIAVL
jgi:hypothetical protein